MTKEKLLELIVNVVSWMNGALLYDDAKNKGIRELLKLHNICAKINREMEK